MTTLLHSACLTLRVGDGKKIFATEPVAEWACLTIRAACSFRLVAFVVMPDHVHVLYTAPDIKDARDTARLLQYTLSSIPEIKGRGIRDLLSFPADTEAMKKMILENPIRKKLCKTIADWPWSSVAPDPLLLLSLRAREAGRRAEHDS